MSFRLLLKSVISNDFEQRNGRWIALFHLSICGRIYAPDCIL